jgi:hypothetical protein
MGNRLYIDCNIASNVAAGRSPQAQRETGDDAAAVCRRRSPVAVTAATPSAAVGIPAISWRARGVSRFAAPSLSVSVAALSCHPLPAQGGTSTVLKKAARSHKLAPRGCSRCIHGSVRHAGGQAADFSGAEHRIHPRDPRSAAPYVRQRAIVITPRRSHGHLGGLSREIAAQGSLARAPARLL